MPRRRGSTTLGTERVSVAGMTSVSVVSRLSHPMKMSAPLRLARTVTSKRSSGSVNTQTSSPAAVPTSCRHTWYGR